MDPTKERHQILSISRRKVWQETLVMIKTSFRGREHEPYTKSLDSSKPKKRHRWKKRSQEHDHHFLWRQEIVEKEFVLAGQTVNSARYCDVLRRMRENVWRLRPEHWLLHNNNASSHNSFFTREFLTKNNTTVAPNPPYVSLFPRLKIQLKGHHFDTIEVIEAESQAVRNTLKEHDFPNAFKNIRSAGNSVYARKGTT
jgi:hypothetical protein